MAPLHNPRGRKRRIRIRRYRSPSLDPVARPKPYTLSESEFVEWIREMASDPKWKNPTAWDEHTFRVGVMIELRKVRKLNTHHGTTA